MFFARIVTRGNTCTHIPFGVMEIRDEFVRVNDAEGFDVKAFAGTCSVCGVHSA